jgi:hypothetical protein
MKTLSILFAVTGLLYGCNTSTKTENDLPDSANSGLIGAWSWASTSLSNQDTSYVWTNVDGQVIFTENQYSLIYIFKSEPRDTVPGLSFETLTADQLRGVYGPVTANSGSYKVEGDSLLFFREVALWPNAMASERQPLKMRLPTKITRDSLVWHSGDFVHVWVKKQ